MADAAPAAPDARPWSLWAIASAFCAALPVPPLCVIGPLLGLTGLSQSRKKGYRGGRLAVLGIVVGFGATAGWTGAFAWYGLFVTRPLLLNGPVAPMQAAARGDVDAFLARFDLDSDDPEIRADATAFARALGDRYGSLLTSQQAQGSEPVGEPPETPGTVRVRYECRFERSFAPLEAELVIRAPDRLMPVLRWRSVTVYDAAGGNLVFPEAARSRMVRSEGSEMPMEDQSTP